MKYLFLIALSVQSVVFGADYYPSASRFGDFQAGVRQGIVGGIPSRSGGTVIQAATYGFATGASAATNAAAISSALAASSEGDVILLPAGEFQMSQVTISSIDDMPNRTIRGAGMASTVINATGSIGFFINGDSNYQNAFNPIDSIATLTSGSATITVADATGLPSPTGVSDYRIARIELVNEAVTPVVSKNGYAYVRTPTVLVTARSGTTLTLSQPLPSAFPNGSSGAFLKFGSQSARHTRGVGIEDMTIDGTDAGVMSSAVYFSFVTGCWVKGVKAMGHGTYAIRFSDTVNCEVRGCWTDVGTGGGSNFAGLKLEQASYFLAEDNILVNNSPVVEMDYASTSNVLAYNYCGGGYINVNHGPHNSFNLFEGNAYWFTMSDAYYGGSSEETFYRNWMKSGVITVQKALTRNGNIIANVVGTPGETYTKDYSDEWGLPNINNLTSSGTWELSTGSYSVDWDPSNSRPRVWTGTLKTRTDNITGVFELDSGMATTFNTALANALGNKRNLSYPDGVGSSTITVTGVSGNDVSFTVDNISYSLPSTTTVMWMVPGPLGFQEKDLDVANTTVRKGNYYVYTGDIPSGEALGADTLANSYFRTEKPAFFGTLSWPPYSPLSPPASTAAGNVAIPAGYRYINGSEDYIEGSTNRPAFSLRRGSRRR